MWQAAAAAASLASSLLAVTVDLVMDGAQGPGQGQGRGSNRRSSRSRPSSFRQARRQSRSGMSVASIASQAQVQAAERREENEAVVLQDEEDAAEAYQYLPSMRHSVVRGTCRRCLGALTFICSLM